MRTYYVYISRTATQSEWQLRISATQDLNYVQNLGRADVPAIWKVVGAYGSEHAKGQVLAYEVLPNRQRPNGVTRIR